jgi:hypothetical protein
MELKDWKRQCARGQWHNALIRILMGHSAISRNEGVQGGNHAGKEHDVMRIGDCLRCRENLPREIYEVRRKGEEWLQRLQALPCLIPQLSIPYTLLLAMLLGRCVERQECWKSVSEASLTSEKLIRVSDFKEDDGSSSYSVPADANS